MTAVDWKRYRAYVEPAEGVGLARWLGTSIPLGRQLVDAMRQVLLGARPGGVVLTKRAQEALAALEIGLAPRVDLDRTVLLHDEDRTRWWTWAGGSANAVLSAALDDADPSLLDAEATYTNGSIPLRTDAGARELTAALDLARSRHGLGLNSVSPAITRRAIQDLKFAEVLPEELAIRTLAARLADHEGARTAAAQQIVERFT